MPRILILTPQLPHPPQAFTGRSQGTTIRNFNLIARLARRHTIDLLTFLAPTPGVTDADGLDGASIDEVALLRPYCRNIVAAAPPVRTLAQRGWDTLFNALPDMALRLESPAMHAHLDRLLRENDYDVIQVEGIEMAPYALRWLAARGPVTGADRARPRLIFDDHNAEYLLQKRAFTTDVRRPRRWLGAAYSLVQWQKLAHYERRICRAADGVAAVSEADRAALQALAPGLHVTVVPNGVDLDFYRPGVVPPLPGLGANALVFTGKMDYRPNVDAVLWFTDAVLPRILAQIPDAHFYVVGQQPHARLAHLAGHPAVTLTGRVPDVRPYIAGAGVFVVPLRIGGGTRLKVLEAMAMGQALVSTRLGCDGFTFEDGREVRFADDPAAFADAVSGLLRDRGRAAHLGRAARAYVEAYFGWDAIVPLLEGLYP
ncbi:MAG: glycosyl transferase family 1 [Chloroflexi bacterium HGW-Chloroflexi-1]|nr:MAG: glycosyl transferase family 1 [Chloroflexi bacterium HGW-Chloroflexi-1]